MRRDAEVAPKCLLRSIVTRKTRDSLEMPLGAKNRRRRRRRRESREIKEISERRESWESEHGGLHHHLIITEQCP